jgi:hypothetical protein
MKVKMTLVLLSLMSCSVFAAPTEAGLQEDGAHQQDQYNAAKQKWDDSKHTDQQAQKDMETHKKFMQDDSDALAAMHGFDK